MDGTLFSKITLKRDNNSEDCKIFLKQLYHDPVFSDVTLVSDDGNSLQAHKSILSSSSPYFLELFKDENNSNSNTLILPMKITPLLEVIYLGETTIEMEDVNDFLHDADQLKITGLSVPVKEKQEKGIEKL